MVYIKLFCVYKLNNSEKNSNFHFEILKKSENVYVNATLEISKLAKKCKEDAKVIVISLENQELKLKRLGIALRESIKIGNWLIVENTHLLKEWPNELLKLLYVKINFKYRQK